MQGFSIIMPIEGDRIPLLKNTIEKYKEFDNLEGVEFIFPTRSLYTEDFDFMEGIDFNVKRYKHEGTSFNPSKALNLGLKLSKYNNIIITCPEVKPKTNVIKQLKEAERANIVCQVFDSNKNGKETVSLVNTNYRSGTPSMYFLACFKKEDLKEINGWNESFMNLYGYEDDEFGIRFANARLKHIVRDDIQAVHQWHPRFSLNSPQAKQAQQLFLDSRERRLIKPKNGLKKLEEDECKM